MTCTRCGREVYRYETCYHQGDIYCPACVKITRREETLRESAEHDKKVTDARIDQLEKELRRAHVHSNQ